MVYEKRETLLIQVTLVEPVHSDLSYDFCS